MKILMLLLPALLCACTYTNMGDSVGLPITGGDAYPDIVGERTGASTDNQAVKGMVIAELIAEIEQDGLPDASLITISIGGNDALLGAAAHIIAGCESCLADTDAYLRDRFAVLLDMLEPHGNVVLLTIYNPMPDLTDELAEQYLADFNEWLAEQACEHDVRPARVDLLIKPEHVSFDMVHLTREGQAVIADAVLNASC